MKSSSAVEDIWLVYDDECPVCRTYCKYVRIRDTVGRLHLVDARQPGELMDEITAAGLDIDQGMVVKVGSQLYYGSDAIHALSLMSTRAGFFNRLSYWSFRSKLVAGLLYPLLRTLRNLLLKMLGKTKINNMSLPNNDRF